MDEKRLSIVIPVYNLENYIAQTLDSCLCQDIPQSEYEIVCIDDGSKDGSVEILNRYAREHSNVVVYAKENGGVSSARNKGIELARGKFIWFVDGDDLVASNILGAALSFAEAENVDAFKFQMQHTHSRQPQAAAFFAPVLCEEPEQIPGFMTEAGGIGGGVCVQWIRRQLLLEGNIRFAEGIHYSEDVLFSFQVMLCSKRCAKTDSVLYFYYQRPGSAIHSSNHLRHAESMHLLSREYDKMAMQYAGTVHLDTIKSKRAYAIKAMLFSLIQNGDAAYLREKLREVKEEGLYPYPLLWKSLKNNQTWKQAAINYLSFLFPCRWYVMLCVRFVALKKKLRR